MTRSKPIEEALSAYIPGTDGVENVLSDAMRYSLLGGGKRLRGTLVLEFALLFGGEQALNKAMAPACAVEMVHAHSLIHDDLPCMDDDDYRRGKPSCHKAFGEDVALLAGDALLNLAFQTIAEDPLLSDGQKSRSIAALCRGTGVCGMLGGQAADMYYENRVADEAALDRIQSLKTGALIRAACELGCIAADVSQSDVRVGSARIYADCIGRAFQITDDILDVTSTYEMLGKPVGSDRVNNKSTYVSLLGTDGAAKKARLLTKKAVDAIKDLKGSDELVKIAYAMLERMN